MKKGNAYVLSAMSQNTSFVKIGCTEEDPTSAVISSYWLDKFAQRPKEALTVTWTPCGALCASVEQGLSGMGESLGLTKLTDEQKSVYLKSEELRENGTFLNPEGSSFIKHTNMPGAGKTVPEDDDEDTIFLQASGGSGESNSGGGGGGGGTGGSDGSDEKKDEEKPAGTKEELKGGGMKLADFLKEFNAGEVRAEVGNKEVGLGARSFLVDELDQRREDTEEGTKDRHLKHLTESEELKAKKKKEAHKSHEQQHHLIPHELSHVVQQRQGSVGHGAGEGATTSHKPAHQQDRRRAESQNGDSQAGMKRTTDEAGTK
jgi:hypothetical protein